MLCMPSKMIHKYTTYLYVNRAITVFGKDSVKIFTGNIGLPVSQIKEKRPGKALKGKKCNFEIRGSKTFLGSLGSPCLVTVCYSSHEQNIRLKVW